ncbi:Apoptosis regulator [Macleaya cordata]|uniref:Apoptosis regulator n=1 Tax=Macleaya cordata TaxID=56857 RepID=A0A200QZY9_MACCD|nr:Apoptosis regulator [Macleaya cordata]
MASEWAQLPPDLIEAIANRITVYIDYIWFRAVCVSWRSAVPKFPNHNHLPLQLPWLMVPSIGKDCESQIRFFSPSENKYHLLELPECRGKRVCGSSLGWLLMLERGPAINLFNPFTRTLIPLPPLTAFPHVEFRPSIGNKEFIFLARCRQYTYSFRPMHDFFIRKMVLSSSPSSSSSSRSLKNKIEEGDDYMVVAILRFRELVFMKKGDQFWTLISDPEFEFENGIFHKGRFFAVDIRSRVAVCDFDGPSPKVTLLLPGPEVNVGLSDLYLVDCSGILLLVKQYTGTTDYITKKFMVYKLDQSGLEWHWKKVRYLGSRALFLGPNSSVSVLTDRFHRCQRNCIYFADYYSDGQIHNSIGGHDLRVFNLNYGSIKTLPCNLRQYCALDWSPPIWITPNPTQK